MDEMAGLTELRQETEFSDVPVKLQTMDTLSALMRLTRDSFDA